MNETEIRERLHRDGGDLTTMAREVISAGSWGPLMNKEALTAVAEKLDGIAAHAFLLRGAVEQAITDLSRQ